MEENENMENDLDFKYEDIKENLNDGYRELFDKLPEDDKAILQGMCWVVEDIQYFDGLDIDEDSDLLLQLKLDIANNTVKKIKKDIIDRILNCATAMIDELPYFEEN